MKKIIDNFEKHISQDYYACVNAKIISLNEKNTGGKKGEYNVDFNIDDSLIVIRDIEKLKMTKNSNYIKAPPSDCDYILLSLNKKKIYFIELKDTDIKKTKVKKQIVAGHNWLNHLLFCADLHEKIIEDWKKINICVRYKSGRPSLQKSNTSEVQGEKIHFVIGNKFILNKFR